MLEIAVGTVGRRHAFVDLKNLDLAPGHLLVHERAQHQPRRPAAAQRQRTAAARRHGGARRFGNDLCTRSGHRIGIGKHLESSFSTYVDEVAVLVPFDDSGGVIHMAEHAHRGSA